MDELDLLIDLHVGNDRQAPGGEAETRRAIELAGLDPSAPLEIADFGCGTGASALVLAQGLNARITAIDAAARFIERLRERAENAGLADRITGRVERMEASGFEARSLDVIWSEGAIYNMGFDVGLRAWKPLLRPGGVLAVTELTWTTAQRPAEIERHWSEAYPGIRTPSANLRALEEEGFRPLAMFFLPDRCWEEGYYRPLRAGFRAYLDRHPGSETARDFVDAEEEEYRLFREHGAWYGYAFYIARTIES